MKEWLLKPFRSNGELSNYYRNRSGLQTPKARREAVKIAVIDDEPFEPMRNLKSHGYNITEIGDVKSIKEVSEYDIVLCDIIGVGKAFTAATQGASIIKEIKAEYPSKIVIAYTGGAPNDKAQQIIREHADLTLRKDIDIEDWTEKLDQKIAEALNPQIIWQKMHVRLAQVGVDAKAIVLLEDAFVQSISDKDSGMHALKRVSSSTEINADARAIITGIIGNAIFSVIAG